MADDPQAPPEPEFSIDLTPVREDASAFTPLQADALARTIATAQADIAPTPVLKDILNAVDDVSGSDLELDTAKMADYLTAKTENPMYATTAQGTAGKRLRDKVEQRVVNWFKSVPNATSLSPEAARRARTGVILETIVSATPLAPDEYIDAGLRSIHSSIEKSNELLAKEYATVPAEARTDEWWEQVNGRAAAIQRAKQTPDRDWTNLIMDDLRVPQSRWSSSVDDEVAQEWLNYRASLDQPSHAAASWYTPPQDQSARDRQAVLRGERLARGGQRLRQLLGDRSFGGYTEEDSLDRAIGQTTDTLAQVLGVSGPEAVRMFRGDLERTAYRRRAKDLGIVDGNPALPGAYAENGTGGYDPILFMDTSVQNELLNVAKGQAIGDMNRTLKLQANYDRLIEQAPAELRARLEAMPQPGVMTEKKGASLAEGLLQKTMEGLRTSMSDSFATVPEGSKPRSAEEAINLATPNLYGDEGALLNRAAAFFGATPAASKAFLTFVEDDLIVPIKGWLAQNRAQASLFPYNMALGRAIGNLSTNDEDALKSIHSVSEGLSVAMQLGYQLFVPSTWGSKLDATRLLGPELRGALKVETESAANFAANAVAETIGKTAGEEQRALMEEMAGAAKGPVRSKLRHIAGFFYAGALNLVSGLSDGVIQGMKTPELIPLFYAGNEAIGALGQSRAFRSMGQVLDRTISHAARTARADIAISSLLRFDPQTGEKFITAIGRAAAEAPATVAEALNRLTAHAKAWHELVSVDPETAALGNNPALKASLRNFSRRAAKLFPHYGEYLEFGSLIENYMVRAEPSFFKGFTAVRDMVQSTVGGVPTRIRADLAGLFSQLHTPFLRDLLQRATNIKVAGDDLVNLKSRAALALSNGDEAGYQISMDVIRAHFGEEGLTSTHAWLKDLTAVEDLYLQARSKGTVAGVDRASMKPEQADLVTRLDSKVRSLMAGTLPDKWDMATLLALDAGTTPRSAPFWDRLGRLLYKVTGNKPVAFAEGELGQKMSAARRLLTYFQTTATDFYGAKLMDNLRKLRLDHAYTVAKEKVRVRVDELVVAREQAQAANDLPTLEMVERALDTAKGEMQGLGGEWRRALVNPTGEAWGPTGKLLARALTTEDWKLIGQTDPVLWDNFYPQTGQELAAVRQDPVKRARLKTLLGQRSDLRARARVLAKRQFILDSFPIDLAKDSPIPSLRSFAARLDKGLRVQGEKGVVAFSRWSRALVTIAEHLKAGIEAQRAKAPVAREVAAAQGAKVKEAFIASLNYFQISGLVGADQAKVLSAIMRMVPDRYWSTERGINLNILKEATGPGGRWGDSSAWEQLIQMWDLGINHSVTALGHEWAHSFLHTIADDTTIKQLFDIYNKTYVKEHPENVGKPEFREFLKKFGKLRTEEDVANYLKAVWSVTATPDVANVVRNTSVINWSHESLVYWDHFTEWFARQFSGHLVLRAGEELAPELKPLLDKLIEKYHGSAQAFAKDIADDGTSTEWTNWFNRFMRGEQGETTMEPKSTTFGEVYRNEAWYKFATSALKELDLLADKAPPEVKLVLRGQWGMNEAELRDMIKRLDVEWKSASALIDEWNKRAGRPPWSTKGTGEVFDVMATTDWEKHSSQVARNAERRRGNYSAIEGMLTPPSEGAMYRKLGNLLTTHNPRNLVDGIAQIKQLERQALLQGTPLNPFDLLSTHHLTFWEQIRMSRAAIRAAEQNASLVASEFERLASSYERMSPEEKELLSIALEKGLPASMLPPNSEIGPVLDRLRPVKTTQEAVLANLDNWLKTDGEAQSKLLETAHEYGFIDDNLYVVLRRSRYNPHLYGIYERPKLIKSTEMREARRALQHDIGATGSVAGVDGREMSLARDLVDWRVRVQEADGFIRDQRFYSEEQAIAYMRAQFDDKILDRAVGAKSGDKLRLYSTLSGDTVTLAKPIREEADILDLLTAEVHENPKTGKWEATEKPDPIARLESFSKLNRDIHAYAMLQSMKGLGMVLTEKEFNANFLGRTGQKGIESSGAFAGAYVQLPADRHTYGDLAGAYVHRNLVSALNNLHFSYDQLRAWFDALEGVWMRAGKTPGGELVSNIVRKAVSFDEKLGAAVRTTQILYNWKTWVGNVTSNLIFSNFATDGRAFHPRHFGAFAAAFGAVFGDTFLGRVLPTKLAEKLKTSADGWLKEAIQNGVISGALFERAKSPELRTAALRLAGMGDTRRLAARYAKLQDLLARLEAKQSVGQPVKDLQLEVVAIEQALLHAQRPFMQKFADWIFGLGGVSTTNRLGLPSNAVTATARSLYGKVDDFFKLGAYITNRMRGMDPAEATWHIKAFMQDYANVPAGIQRLSRSPIGALVPSFAYEMSRITSNMVRFKPGMFVSTFGAVAAFNGLAAVRAGINDDRRDAMERARGRRTWIDQTLGNLTRLRWYDPVSRTMVMDLDLGDTFLPNFAFADSFSALGRVAEGMSDPDERSGMQSAMVLGMKFAGNFVLGRPAFSMMAAFASGRDPVTGKPLMEKEAEKRSVWDYTRAIHRVTTQSVIPPLMPGGRGWENISDAWQRPVSPDTGRAYGGPSFGSSLIKELTNVGVTGWPAKAVSDFFGKADKIEAVDDKDILKMLLWQATKVGSGPGTSEVPIYGGSTELRELWARQRAEGKGGAAEVALKAHLTNEDRMTVGNRKYARDMDEFQLRQAMKTMDDRGVLSQFDRLSPWRQAAVLLGADATGLNDQTFAELVSAMVTTTGAARMRLALSRNPFEAHDASQIIKDYIKERPSAAGKFERVLNWLRFTEARATGIFKRMP